jgi:hypothetical protein
MNIRYLNSLSRIFTPIVLDKIAERGHSSYLTEVCYNTLLSKEIDKNLSLFNFFNWVYDLLFKNYRNEYIYKNIIANKILLGKHNLSTAQMLTEFRAGKCKADAVIINGTSTVYEIKSEFDSFTRLQKQLDAYSQVFDHINIITSLQQTQKLLPELPEKIGILVVTNRNTISTIRDSISNKKNIKPSILFDSLRKNEYLNIVKQFYGYIPDVPNTIIFKECKKLYEKIQPEIAHDLTMAMLRNRNESISLNDFLEKAPDSLSAYIVSNANNRTKLRSLLEKMPMNIETIIAPV